MNRSTLNSANSLNSISTLSKSKPNLLLPFGTISNFIDNNRIDIFRNNYIKCIDSHFYPKILNDLENKSYSSSSSKNKKKFKKIKSIWIHRKISRIPYSLKNEEAQKLIFINEKIKNKKLSKYSSQPIDKTYNNDLSYNNINYSPKKKNKQISYFLESENNKFKQKFYFKEDKGRKVFNLYLDYDIIEKSNELNDQLIENSFDMDQETDEDNLEFGDNICISDIQKGCELIAEDPNIISYIKHKQANIK